jgi:hypothetical protein
VPYGSGSFNGNGGNCASNKFLCKLIQNGNASTREIQRIYTNAITGLFTLTYETSTTGWLNWNSTAAGIESALNSLSSVSSVGGVTVSGNNEPVVTRYLMDGNVMRIYEWNYVTETWVQKATDSDRTSSYQPDEGQVFTMDHRTAQESGDLRKVSVVLNGWVWIGHPKIRNDLVDRDTTLLDKVTLMESEYLVLANPQEDEYDYTYLKVTIDANILLMNAIPAIAVASWDSAVPDVDEYWYEETYKDFHTHAVSADNPVSITFSGYDAGIINISSAAGIWINGPVENLDGTTVLTASNGGVQLWMRTQW